MYKFKTYTKHYHFTFEPSSTIEPVILTITIRLLLLDGPQNDQDDAHFKLYSCNLHVIGQFERTVRLQW